LIKFLPNRKNNLLLDILKYSTPQLKAELWSIFIAILRKSQINLQICVENGFIETMLGELEDSNEVCAGKPCLAASKNHKTVYCHPLVDPLKTCWLKYSWPLPTIRSKSTS
jgi:hypothetical protein